MLKETDQLIYLKCIHLFIWFAAAKAKDEQMAM